MPKRDAGKSLTFRLPWRQPPIDHGPIRLSSRRLNILPTRMGLVFGGLLLGFLMVSTNYGISLGYLFTFLLAGVGVVGLFHSQRNLLGLTLYPLPVSPVFAGERAQFRLRLDNPGRRMRGGLVLIHPQAVSESLDLDPGGSDTLVLSLEQTRRGWHGAGRLSLASTWPLGLYRCWTVFQFDWGGLVYPKPAAPVPPLPEPRGAGLASAWRQTGDDEFSALRDYRPGDSPRSIAWKSMARGKAPLIKQFAGSGGGELWLNWADCPSDDTEARLSILTRWSLDAEHAGHVWGLALPAQQITPGRGADHLDNALEALARHDQV